MKKILMFKMAGCPYCQRAFKAMEELYEANPIYKEIPLEMIDEKEHPEIADQYDYYYVPTYYVEDKKMAEGVLTKEDIERVFKAAL